MRLLRMIGLTLVLGLLLVACRPAAMPEPTQPPINMPVVDTGSEAYPAPVDSSGSGSEAYPMPPDTPVMNPGGVGPYPSPGETAGIPPSGFEPAAGDENLTRGEAFVELPQSEMLALESYPLQVNLILRGNLPTPCHLLRVIVTPADSQNRIQVTVYSVVDPNKVCTQALEPFEARIPLGSYSGAKYSVYVNGTLLGEFDS